MPRQRRLIFDPIRSLCVALPVLVLFASIAAGQTDAAPQSSAGDTTLDEAFSAKLAAKSTRDLDKVVDLCEQAIEEGLDEEGTEQAKQLAAAALFEHAERLARPILSQVGRDRRWQIYRRQALSRLKKATEYDPKMGAAWLLVTKLHGLPGGDNKRAAQAVEKAIELAGDDRRQLSAALFLRAGIAGKTGDEDTLLADLDQAIKIDPDNTQAYQVRGLYYLRKRDPEKAMEDLTRWLDSSDRAIDSVLVVDRLIAMDDKFDQSLQEAALDILADAIKKDPNSPDPYHARARVHTVREDIDAALADLDKAMELAPDTDRLSRFRARLLVSAERWEEANSAIDEILKKNPNDVEMSELRMAILIDQAKYSDAIDQLRKLIRMSPDSISLRRQLAALYNADDRPSQAIRVYSRLLDDVSEDKLDNANDQQRLALLSTRSSLLQGRGNARLSTGEHKEAIEDYEAALDASYQLRDLLDEMDLNLQLKREDATLVGVLNNFAWVLATSPEDDLRDGERSIELATEAAELTDFKEAYILSTLASGYAEAGDFDKAMEWIDKAIAANTEEEKQIKEDEKNAEELKRNREQSESLSKEKASYVDKKPWREKQDVEAERKAAEAESSEDSETADDRTGSSSVEEKPNEKPSDNASSQEDADEKNTRNKSTNNQPDADNSKDGENESSDLVEDSAGDSDTKGEPTPSEDTEPENNPPKSDETPSPELKEFEDPSKV